MRPEQLKNSILQLAIQGKLVEQREEEGTGEELYKVIHEEKKKLIEEEKIKKPKTLPEISEDEIPFDIPEKWKWVRLGDSLDVRDGTHDSPKYVKEGIPLVTSKNLKNGIIDFDTCKYISEFDHIKISERSKVDRNDILFAMIGSIGNPVLVSIDEEFSIKNMALFKNISSIMDMKYVYWFLLFSQEIMKKKASGGVQSFVSLKFLREFLLPLPPLEEQKRIVGKIEEILPLVERYDKEWTRLEELNKKFPQNMKKSILDEAIKGKLVEQRKEEGTGEELYKVIHEEKKKLIEEEKIKKPKTLPEISEDEIPFDIPEKWKWVRLGNLSKSVQYGYNAPAKSKGRIKMVRISDIQGDSICWDTVPYCEISEDEIEQYLLKNNDILFARTGGTVGKSYLVKNISENAIYAGYLIRTQYGKNIVPQFLKYFMGSELYWMQLRTGTIATAQPNCNGQTLSKMIIPLPPLAEQKRIVEKIEELLPLCEKLK